MHRPNSFNSATLYHVPGLISRSRLWRGFPVVLLVLSLFALWPTARAVDPPPDGGYPNNNTAEGANALNSLTTGTDNTAIGSDALYSNTGSFGSWNTAVGSRTLSYNTTGYRNTAIGFDALLSNTVGGSHYKAIGAFSE